MTTRVIGACFIGMAAMRVPHCVNFIVGQYGSISAGLLWIVALVTVYH